MTPADPVRDAPRLPTPRPGDPASAGLRRRSQRPPRPRRSRPPSPSVLALIDAFAGRPPLTASDLRALTGLARRTVCWALQELRLRGWLREQRSLRDARQTFFWLAATPGPEHLGVVPVPSGQVRVGDG